MMISQENEPVSPIPWEMIKPRRKIEGICAVLLPFKSPDEVDWESYEQLIIRVVQYGLTPAINMDTGYVNLIGYDLQDKILRFVSHLIKGEKFIAGAFVHDTPGSPCMIDVYRQRIQFIQSCNAIPILFQSYGLKDLPTDEVIKFYETMAQDADRFLAFELTPRLACFGRIYDLQTIHALIQIPQCLGMKHSSFQRVLEWQRLALRDRVRPDFKIYTGNDEAIDMVMYGSDYLLGLSTFAPDFFALRDQYWLSGDPQFYEINDLLQYLGCLAFRHPAAAYKHTAAQFLKIRGWISSSVTPRGALTRSESDQTLLLDIAHRLARYSS